MPAVTSSGRDRVPAFTAMRSSSRLVTRRHTFGGPAREAGHDVRAGRQELFQVVEHEERGSIAQVGVEGIADGSLG